ncbi:MAG: AAA family ATPase [Planctomycetaceae bacterium]
MQEHQVTAAGMRFPLEEPFFVLATQNPIEMEGTYPLPEAQLDRFCSMSSSITCPKMMK